MLKYSKIIFKVVAMLKLAHRRWSVHTFWVLLIGICLSFELFACSLVMGYRTNERLPLIAKAPDSSGLYRELYSRAASKIGCSIEVRRLPKNRILRLMQLGKVDFYPGFDFTLGRSQYTYYIFNGLPGGHVGISRLDFREINHLSQLTGKVLLLSQGASNLLENLDFDVKKIKIKQPPEINITQAVSMIKNYEADFYIYDISSIYYYLGLNNESEIQVHKNCCNGVKPMYLGFSKESKHIALSENPTYDASSELSVDNYPQRLKGGSIAQQLQSALAQMHADGEIKQIYEKYYP